MLPLGIQRVFIATYKIDFRKRFDGLLAEAYRLNANPYKGDCVVFLKKDHTQLRAIAGDRLGLFLICRRFDNGSLRTCFSWTQNTAATEISFAELSMLLEGASFTVHKRVSGWRQNLTCG